MPVGAECPQASSASDAPGRVLVREATPRDFRAISDLFEEVDSLHREHLPDLFRRAQGAPREETFINGLIKSPDAGVFVAQMGVEIVGLLVAVIHKTPDFPILVPLRYAMVDTIVVTARARGRGIGYALMAHVEAWARERRIDRIELNVFEFNEAALSFYRGMNYSVLSCRMVKRLDVDV
jgi:diamine N-acetyltransferase